MEQNIHVTFNEKVTLEQVERLADWIITWLDKNEVTALIVAEEKGENNGQCAWTEQDEGEYYSTSCGHDFFLDSGTPADNGMRFCPMCGKTLVCTSGEEPEEAGDVQEQL